MQVDPAVRQKIKGTGGQNSTIGDDRRDIGTNRRNGVLGFIIPAVGLDDRNAQLGRAGGNG